MTDRLPLPQEIIEGLARIAAAARHPFGPPSFRSLAQAHIAVLGELRCQGASWGQIGALLAERGITRTDGRPIAEAVLRATVSAARRAADISAAEAGERTEDAERGETKRSEALGHDTQRSETKQSKAQVHETRRSEMQQHENVPQQNALSRSPTQRAAVPRNRRNEPAQNELIAPAVPPQQASGRHRHPLLGLDDALLRRAEYIQKFHKPENH